MAITGMRLVDWNQFVDVDVTFGERCTVLTGANGAGKSTMLRILAKHAGWDFYDLRIDPVEPGEAAPGIPADHRWISEIRYAEGERPASLSQEIATSRKEPRIHVSGLRDERCIYIPAIRPMPPARPGPLPDVGSFDPQAGLQQVAGALLAANGGQSAENPLLIIARFLQTQIGAGAVAPSVRRFMEVSLELLPPELGIERFEIVAGRVALTSEDGRFAFNAISGGTASIILAAWLCTMFDAQGPGTVLFDEPENHLHPRLQRSILPALVKAFPGLQFIVATHSPLVVGSVPGAQEYALHFGEDGVRAQDLSPLVRAGTATDFLEDVLGVSFGGPIWVEEALRSQYEWLASRPFTEETLREFERRMTAAGLERFTPRTLLSVLQERIA